MRSAMALPALASLAQIVAALFQSALAADCAHVGPEFFGGAAGGGGVTATMLVPVPRRGSPARAVPARPLPAPVAPRGTALGAAPFGGGGGATGAPAPGGGSAAPDNDPGTCTICVGVPVLAPVVELG